ncbi:glutamate racemase [Sphingorhabdus sp. M41]|uniref:glutamate racemase n=1 Tax=Sphingorhabdus sp. M41 TaxID=1806885 RepID=UPI00078EF60B|nr:glutamate racemase [Sphingorhabdus sp. M41]AMO71739.1 glutamate racemase [Sphingorhabdus sp. M41]
MTEAQNGECPPLLFFDTGVGGLSVLGETIKLLPNAPIVYAADYAGLPYGMKSEAELAARVPALLGRLVERYKPQLVTIACNTASTIALDHVRSALDIPVVGTVPAIKPASEMTNTGVIGLLGTKATIRQPYVDRLASDFAADKILLRHAAPGLVYAAEAKLRGEKPDVQVIEEAMFGLIDQAGGKNMDTVIMACTHFPLLRDELAAAAQRPVQFIDGAQGIARRIAYLTKNTIWPSERRDGIFVTTGDIADIEPYRPAFAEYGIRRFEKL